jgi:hypothetical protein
MKEHPTCVLQALVLPLVSKTIPLVLESVFIARGESFFINDEWGLLVVPPEERMR